jgi:hypothetical protein
MRTGELGIDKRQPHATEYVDTALDAYDDDATGWAWWQWRQDDHWSVEDRGGAVDVAWLRHLARPFLAFAPPGVRAGRGDGVHGTLTLSIADRRSDQPAIVSWPGYTLGAPRVSGSCLSAARWDATSGQIFVVPFRDGPGCVVAITASGSG